MLGLLGLLAVIGVLTLFAGAIGLIRFGARGQGADMTRRFVDAMGEGVLVTDRDGRIIYANRAYADLTGAASERDVRAVERALLRRCQRGGGDLPPCPARARGPARPRRRCACRARRLGAGRRRPTAGALVPHPGAAAAGADRSRRR